MVRATEIEIRLREQELNAAIISLRPATEEETEVFFRAMDILEAAIPGPIAAGELRMTETSRGQRNVL